MNDPKTRKKLLWAAVLGGVMLCSLVFITTLAPQGEPVADSPVIRTNDQGEIFLTDEAAPADRSEEDSPGFSLGGGELVSLAWRLALVAVIIAVSIAGLRWWGKKTAGPKSTTGFLRVVDTLAISNGRSIHLVALGDRVIAVGATAQQLSLLNELSDDEAARVRDMTAQDPTQPIATFAAELFQSMRGMQRPGTRTPRNESVIGETR